MAKSKDIKIEVTSKHHHKVIMDTIEFLLQGYRYSEIVEYLEITYSLNKNQAKYAIKESTDQIIELGDFDLEMVIVQHVINYEEAIRFFDEIKNYSAKSSAMSAKEKLLKIYEDESKSIEIENTLNINVDQFDYNIDKLTTEEKNRFQKLIDKVTSIQ